GDVGPPVLGLFSLYYERRDRVVHLAREYSLLIANFGDSDHLKIEEITPSTAVRRQSRVRAGGEVVALTLLPSQDATAQSLRVQFHYFGGRINWRPVVISALVLLVTNFAGVLMFSLEMNRRIRPRRRARRRARRAGVGGGGGGDERQRPESRKPGPADPRRHAVRRGGRAVRAPGRGSRARHPAGPAHDGLPGSERRRAARGGDRATRQPRHGGHVRHQSLTTKGQGASA